MSLVDLLLIHRAPKRDGDAHGAIRGGQTWFSSKTIKKARQFKDVSWFRLLAPALIGGLLMFAGQTVLTGDGAALSNLLGLIIFLFSLNGIISRAWQDLTRH